MPNSLSNAAPLPPPTRWYWTPFFVLALSLALTIVFSNYVARTTYKEKKLAFATLSQEAADAIKARIEVQIALLRGGAGFIAAEEARLKVSPRAPVSDYLIGNSAFKNYIDRLNLSDTYKGVQGIGFSIRVPAAQKAQFLAAMLAEKPDFQFDPPQLLPGTGPDWHSIVYLEPMNPRNAEALGYNMYSEPVRRAAMQSARDNGVPVATGRVILKQEITAQKQAGFLIYLPVYRGGEAPSTVAERRAKLIGFIYSPLRAGDFLEDVDKSNAAPQLTYRLYDDTGHQQSHLLHTSGPRPAGYRPEFTQRLTIRVAGRDWGISFETLPRFTEQKSSNLAFFVGAVGLLTSAALFGVTWAQSAAMARAERSAAELRESEALRTRLLESERAARQQAEAANRSKDEFLAVVSHELRTPLTSILGWANLLKDGHLDEQTRQRGLETIERNAKAQAQLVEDLLDMSRIIAGKLRLDARPLSLTPPIAAALDAVRPAAQIKQIELVCQISTDGARVAGDPDRIQQIAWNLLSNAIKFTPQGGRVELILQRQGDFVEIVVQDSGIGMAPEFVPFAFDRFRQADASSTRQHGGLGLGLAIVRHLTEMHGGEVAAHSAGPNQGSQFTMRLPALRVPALAAGETTARAPEVPLGGHTPIARLKALKILVIDDETDAREVIAACLQMHGAQVITAADAASGFALLQAHRPDVLVCDIGLPDEDGYGLIARIRHLPTDAGGTTPALALTAYAREIDRAAALAAGFQQHLTKPIAPNTLATAVASLLDGSDE